MISKDQGCIGTQGSIAEHRTISIKCIITFVETSSINIQSCSAIHSFILAISIAPLQVLYYSEALQFCFRNEILKRICSKLCRQDYPSKRNIQTARFVKTYTYENLLMPTITNLYI